MAQQEPTERLDRKVYGFAAVLGTLGLGTLVILVLKPGTNPLFTLFLYSVSSNSVVSFLPHEPVIIFCGHLYRPLMVSLIAGVATGIAGFLDYHIFTPLLNLRTLNSLKKGAVYRKCVRCFWKKPFLIILIAGFSPVPFVPVKILTFSTRYPFRRYAAALLLGRVPRYYILALIGGTFNIPNWALVAIFALILGYIAVRRGPLFRQRGRQGQI